MALRLPQYAVILEPSGIYIGYLIVSVISLPLPAIIIPLICSRRMGLELLPILEAKYEIELILNNLFV
jgi:hypothetical protein